MQPPSFALDSLRSKIILGYSAVAALVIGLSLFLLVDMRLLETQVAAGERIGEFLGLTLEIRRFEKNYFLYRQESDREENRAYVTQAQQLLSGHAGVFASFESDAHILTLARTLAAYDALMASLADDRDRPVREAEIRRAGKEIVTIAETWSHAERQRLQDQLAHHRTQLAVSIAAVVILLLLIGQLLARRVARPLREMEDSLAAVATGRLAKLEMAARDREIVSLVQAFNRMLTELDMRQGQLLRAEKLAALGTLLSGVAHELNNPLSNISTSCEILKEELAAQAGFPRELLEQIDSETWRARRIVRSLLDYARDRDFRSEDFALAPLVEECLRLVKAQIPAQVEVKLDLPAALVIAGDKQRLQQALFNLIGNALDALAGAGTLVIAARVPAPPSPADALVFGKCPARAIEIAVSDDGHGIAAELLPRIFDPFFTTKAVGHGLGLGLFIVFEIVEEHGGCIAVTSQPGQGTTFLLRFPLKDPQ